jgi:hypothetical protein
MSDHVHRYTATTLTEDEAAEIHHPYLVAGSPVFLCIIPECLSIATGNPLSDNKRPRRRTTINATARPAGNQMGQINFSRPA